MKMNKRKIVSLLVVVSAISLPFVAWSQRWNIYDSLRLRNYSAPANIAELATQTTMDDATRRLFYVYYPQLNEKVEFNDNCKTSEKTIVLGCYVSGKGIYLYNVTDERLDGVIQVTAAHETLHAAYDRLSSSEKNVIDSLLSAEFSKLTDQRIKDTIKEYQQNGADVSNELHSILGTEVRTLNLELEKYYSKYFTDRLKIVEFSEKYEQVFTERKKLVDDYVKQMQDIKAQLETLESNLNNQMAVISQKSAELSQQNSQVDQTSRSSVDDYNAKVASYNSLVRNYRANTDQYNQLVAKHNDIYEKYKAVAAEETELIKAIDSRANTLQTQ